MSRENKKREVLNHAFNYLGRDHLNKTTSPSIAQITFNCKARIQ